MKCLICHKKIDYEITFKDIFSLKFTCKECLNKMEAKYTIIPIDNGYNIYYHYFMMDDEYLSEIEYKIYPIIYQLMVKSKKELVILLDDEILPYIEKLNFCQNIILISIIYEKIEDLLIE